MPSGDVSRPVCTLGSDGTTQVKTNLQPCSKETAEQRKTWRIFDDTRSHQIGGKSDT